MENIETIEGKTEKIDSYYYIGIYLCKGDREGAFFEPRCTAMPSKSESHCLECMKYDFERYECKDAKIVKVKFPSLNL